MTAIAFDGVIFAADSQRTNRREENSSGLYNTLIEKIRLFPKPVKYYPDGKFMVGAVSACGNADSTAVIKALELWMEANPDTTIEAFFKAREATAGTFMGFDLFFIGLLHGKPHCYRQTANRTYKKLEPSCIAPWAGFDFEAIKPKLKSAVEYVEVAKLLANNCGGDTWMYDPIKHKHYRMPAWSKHRKTRVKELIVETMAKKIEKAFS